MNKTYTIYTSSVHEITLKAKDPNTAIRIAKGAVRARLKHAKAYSVVSLSINEENTTASI